MAELVPVENAAMPDRSVIQWDKDDLDALGLLKVDILAIGMLSAIRRSLEHIGAKLGRSSFEMQDIADDDTPTYDMICRADTVGVFQIESRAQMSMLPRLQPRCYYDLVVEVAIVRPGPIQGGMVHPYLKNRTLRDDEIDCPEELKPALLRTKGVPIFQEQVMQIAMLAADFTRRRGRCAAPRDGGLEAARRAVALPQAPGRPDGREGLRASSTPSASSSRSRASASTAFRRAMPPASRCSPTSAAGSSATTPMPSCAACSTPSRWASTRRRSWCATRASTASRCGRSTSRVSAWESTLEGEPAVPAGEGARGRGRRARSSLRQPVRLGLNRVKGLAEDAGKRIVAARAEARFADSEDLARRARLDAHALAALAEAGALQSLTGHRHQAAWAVAGIDTRPTEMLRATRSREAGVVLAAPSEGEETLADYRALGLTLNRHPLALLRAAARRLPDRARVAPAHATRTAAWRARAASSRTGSAPRPPRARSSSPSRTRPARSTSSSGRGSPRRSERRCSARRCSPSTASGSARARASGR